MTRLYTYSISNLLMICILTYCLTSCNTANTHTDKEQEASREETVKDAAITQPVPVHAMGNDQHSWRTLDMSTYENVYVKNLLQLPIFKDYSVGGGMVIESKNGVEYGIAHIIKSDTHVMILEKFNRPSYYELEVAVVSAIQIKGVTANQTIGFGNCLVDGSYDGNIIALYEYDKEETEYYEKILKAWKLDRENDKFVEISTENVTCINEGYGA